MLAVIVVLSAMIPRNELNEDALRYFDETFAFRRAVDFAEANAQEWDAIFAYSYGPDHSFSQDRMTSARPGVSSPTGDWASPAAAPAVPVAVRIMSRSMCRIH